MKAEAEPACAIIRELSGFTRREDDNPDVSLNEIVVKALVVFSLRDRAHHVRLTLDLSEQDVMTKTGPCQFEPFSTTKDQGEGTWLGLAIVASMVRDYGAEISLQSEPGRGATFIISFPRTA